MPGAYAHITLVNLCKETRRLEASEIPRDLCRAVTKHFRYCELGAVSPDYPYLKVADSDAQKWADRMHYDDVNGLIVALASRVRSLQGRERWVALAWLMGYVAHVVTDMNIHPVVELKVGPYAQNKRAHRVCEMHQDAWIYARMNLGNIGMAEHLDSGLSECVGDDKELSKEVADLWRGGLNDVFATAFAAHGPEPRKWHSRFVTIVDEFAEEGGKLPAFARHVAVDCGLTYPLHNDVDKAEYIQSLKVPTGRAHYDQVFDQAIHCVVWAWEDLGRLLENPAGSYIANDKGWNLDTGKNHGENLVFWG